MPKTTPSKPAAKTPMTTEAAQRIKSAAVKTTGGQISKDSFVDRAIRAAERNGQ